jgi:hypothetical protein
MPGRNAGPKGWAKMPGRRRAMNIVMRLRLPEPTVRKREARAVQKHKDKTKYTRKCKHKAAGFGGFAFRPGC